MQTKDFPDPQAIVHAYLRGDLQVAQLTTVEVVDICNRLPRRCPVVVLVLDESRGADMVAARPGIVEVSQLRGARVAVTPSTLGPYVLSRALERAGLRLADVRVQTMALSAMAAALWRREVEAAAFFPPFSDYSLRLGLARRLFDSSQIPGEIFDVLVVDPAMADGLMAAREQLSVQRFREAERGLLYPDLVEQVGLLKPNGVLERNLAAVQRVQQELGLVKPGALLPRVDDQPLRQAL